MKLFVAGTNSGYPKYWSPWEEFILLLAENMAEAEAMTDTRPVYEVSMDAATILVVMTEPSWGEDL